MYIGIKDKDGHLVGLYPVERVAGVCWDKEGGCDVYLGEDLSSVHHSTAAAVVTAEFGHQVFSLPPAEDAQP